MGHFSYGFCRQVSYSDSKSLETIANFVQAVEWDLKVNFSDDAMKEAKFGVFQRTYDPTPPSGKGMRLFLNRISDEQFATHCKPLIIITTHY